MFLNSSVKSLRQGSIAKQQGSSLVIAIFIMVVMLLLGAALVKMLASSAETTAYEVSGTRAYNAANAGLQQRFTTIFELNNDYALQCDGDSTELTINGAVTPTVTTNLDLSNVTGLLHCQADISCEDIKINDVTYYKLESTGQCAINGEVTSRTIAVEARSL